MAYVLQHGLWPTAWPMAHGLEHGLLPMPWPVADGRWPMADGRWPAGHVLVADFGLSEIVLDDDLVSGVVGTMQYIPPARPLAFCLSLYPLAL